MKNLIFILFIFQSFTLSAQEAFMKKDLHVNAGVGFINYRERSYNKSERVGYVFPIFASAEYGFSSSISVGPFLGYRQMKFKYNDTMVTNLTGNEVFRSNFWSLGVRGTLHLAPWLENLSKKKWGSEDYDFYTSVMLGYEFNTFSKADGFLINKKSKPLIGLVIGTRYFLNYRVALFGELGLGLYGVFNGGFTARF